MIWYALLVMVTTLLSSAGVGVGHPHVVVAEDAADSSAAVRQGGVDGQEGPWSWLGPSAAFRVDECNSTSAGVACTTNGGNCTDPNLETEGDMVCDCSAITPVPSVGPYCQCNGTTTEEDLCATLLDYCKVDLASGEPDPNGTPVGTCIWDCVEEPSCRCKPETGFVLNPTTGRCEDLDECTATPGVCTGENTVCSNTIGGYNCTCATGFEDDPDNQGSCRRVCPTGSGWVSFGTSCFLSPPFRSPWAEARDYCHGSNSDLVCDIASNEELVFLGKLAQGTVWLGYEDSATEGTYTCAYDETDKLDSNGKPPALQWVNLEPNGGAAENCVILAHLGWASVECGEPHHYVCELKNPIASTCPEGWTLFTSNGAESCYYRSPSKDTFDGASSYCRTTPGADLMIVDSERENDVVGAWHGFIQESGPTWIGYRRTDPSGTDPDAWGWIGTGSPSPYTNWIGDNEPANKPDRWECAVLVPSRLMDSACSNGHNFVCKSRLAPTAAADI